VTYKIIAVDRSTGDVPMLVEARRIYGHEPTIIIIDDICQLDEKHMDRIMAEYGPKEQKPARPPNRDWVTRNQAPRSLRK
jgi:hypothetical protein